MSKFKTLRKIRQLEAEREAMVKAEIKRLPVCKAVDGRLVWVQGDKK